MVKTIHKANVPVHLERENMPSFEYNFLIVNLLWLVDLVISNVIIYKKAKNEPPNVK